MTMRTLPANRRRWACLLLFIAVCLHNLEEALTFPIFRPKAAQLVGSFAPGVALPSAGAFQTALLLLTGAVAGLLLWAAMTRGDGRAWIAIQAVAVVLLVNIVLPHVPAAIALGGYAPGVATAVAVNLPVGLLVLAFARKARRRFEL